MLDVILSICDAFSHYCESQKGLFTLPFKSVKFKEINFYLARMH